MEEINSTIITARERKLYRIIGQLLEIHQDSVDLILDGLEIKPESLELIPDGVHPFEEIKKEITNIN